MCGSTSSSECTLTVRGRDTRQVALNVIEALRSLTGDSGQGDQMSDVESVVPFEAEGRSLHDLIQRLLDDVQVVISESLLEVNDVDLANVLKTDEGLRAWGYLRFSSRPRTSAPPWLSLDPLSRTTAAGETEIRLVVTPIQPPRSMAPRSGDGEDAPW